MSYPRPASAYRQSNSQTSTQPSQGTARVSSKETLRSRTSTPPYPTHSRLQSKLTSNLQLGHYPQPPIARPLKPHTDAKQAQDVALQNPKAGFLAQCRSLFAKRSAWIGVSLIALSMLVIIPARVGSESIDLSSCEKKIKPTGEISRGQMSALLALPSGSNKAAVRRVVDEPYCLLPAIAQSIPDETEGNQAIPGAERAAYPLAFDPEAWVVVTYNKTGEYVGYDFVFKPQT